MSFFLPHLVGQSPVRDIECPPIKAGVTVERRAFLGISGASLVAFLAAPWSAKAQDALRTDEEITLEAFFEEAFPIAEDLVKHDKRNEDAYLYHVASMLARLKAVENPFPDKAPGLSFRTVMEERPLVLVQIRFAPQASIPWHDHRDYNGVILGLEGKLRCRNFDVDREEKETKRVFIKETSSGIVTPGRFSTLSTTRDNIHDLRATESGARVLDVFTFFDDDAGSHYLDVNTDPVDPEERIFEAKWK